MAHRITPDEPRPSHVLRNLGIVLAVIVALLVVVYLVISSSAFVKGVVLPRVGKALNAEITADSVSLSPFSSLALDKLTVKPVGAEPLLTAEQLRVRYGLWSILRGNYVVNELTLASPVIQIVKDANGRSNVDAISKGEPSRSSSTTKSEPMRLAIRNLSIKDGTVRSIENAKDGSVKTTELGALNVGVDRFENGQPGKLNVAGNVKLENRVPAGRPGTNDLAEGKLTGNFDYKLDAKLLPQTLTGNGRFDFARAEGAYADFKNFGAALQAEVTPTEVRQLALRFERAGQNLGRVQASGPMDLAKSEGRLKIEVLAIDRQVLNLFGASHGWDFRDSTINATNYVDVARRGDIVGAEGRIAARQLTIVQGGQATPILDLDADYKLRVTLNEQSAVIDRLTLIGRQQQTDILQASLDRPMTLTWAPNARGFAESTFGLSLTNFNLGDWRSVIGTNAPSGRVALRLNVLAKPDAKELTATGSGGIADLAMPVGTNRLERADVTFSFEALLRSYKVLSLNQYRLEVRQQNQAMVQSSGSGQYDFSKPDLNLQASAEIALPAVLRHFPMPPLTASNGTVRVSSAVRQRSEKYSLTGNVSVADFTGSYGEYAFNQFQSALDYNLDFEKPTLQIHSATLTMRKGYALAGNIGLNGNYDTVKEAGRINFNVTDLNQNVLASILGASLGEKKLVSISLGGSGAAAYDPKGETSLKAGLQVTNWVVASGPSGVTSPKLSAALQVDTSLRDQVLDLRQFQLKLARTERAANELLAKGRLDMKSTNATPSQLTVEAESLDFTPYYDIIAGQASTNASSAPKTPVPAPGAGASPGAIPEAKPTEPEPMKLPVQQLAADLNVKRLYLRQVAVTNLHLAAHVNQGEITLKPIAMTLNGAPVDGTAVVNVGVPGYRYAFSLAADRVPIEPLAESFTTNAPGTYKGDLFANAQFKGAGITGVNLRKNLGGAASLNLTNMHYEIVGKKTKRLLEPIALALRVPELTQTPINWISSQLGVTNGQINVEHFNVKSDAFYAESHGAIPIADVLTNSPVKLPVNLSLRRTLAEKANLLAANTPTNAAYAQLPTFVTLTGTLGEPNTEINKLVLGGLLARSIGGIGKVGDNAGNILEGIGGVLTGQRAASSRTNSPAGTNASPAANIVQGIGGLFNPKSSARNTNPPAASTNRPPGNSPIQDLIKSIPLKK